MKRTFFIPALFLFLALFVFSSLHSQSPQGIPYQAVMRNADGSVMASSAVNLTFMIHDGTANGSVVYQESHALTSNAQGLVSCAVGNGVVSQGTFASINWGNGAKFMHVMMGATDLGTQQMLSVPYALYAHSMSVNISTTGDTLTVGGQIVIVPGISAANPANNTPTSGLGTQVLPGNTICANEYINVVGCNGQTSLTYDGRTYDLVEIGGQCWFADNLATDQYRNGDPIPTGLDNTAWSTTTNGAFAIYNNDPANDATYGKLYNWFTAVDSRGLCPTGWHVPSDCEWMYLESSLGMTPSDLELVAWRGSNEAGSLKSTINWSAPNTGATNSTGFTALPGGARFPTYGGIGLVGTWWTSSVSEYDPLYSWTRDMDFEHSNILRYPEYRLNGFSIRCLKDSETPPIQGCTDGAACNFMANANQDDGSCLYQNATCDDGNANTINDVINGSCECTGTAIVNGCTNAQACNYSASANVDDGSCLIQGATCDDGVQGNINDVVSTNCICSGTPVFSNGNGVVDIDGNYYPSIVINGQEWMQRNLAVTKYRNGEVISSGLNDNSWGTTNLGAFSIYMDLSINNSVYGKLYNWYAVNDSRGICPTGWHVPTDSEWTLLVAYLDPNEIHTFDQPIQSAIAGSMLKSTSDWNTAYSSTTNASGFSALAGGWRSNFGSYGVISPVIAPIYGSYGYWWSSSNFDQGNSWMRGLDYLSAHVRRSYSNKHFGYSVRCLKN